MHKSIFTSVFLSILMLGLLSTFVISRNIPNPPMFVTSTIWALFITFLTFMIYRTGKVARYRSVFFILYAFCFVYVFISHLVETRGSMALTDEIIARKEVPLCPIAIPQLILPLFIKKILIFPTKLFGGPYGGFYPIFFMWLVSVISLGKGWCSWACFYGGITEGFSKVLPKEKLPTQNIDPKLRYLSFYVLSIVVIWALCVMSPVYCIWVCPLKMVTEYKEITTPTAYIQVIIFITLGMALLITLPILTKKRVYCGLFCPLGAMQSIVGLINPYRVKIDKTKCTNCKMCAKVCPVFAITDKAFESCKVSIMCARCGKCMDVCKKKAINYWLLGIPFSTDDRVFTLKLTEITSWKRRLLVMPLRFFEEILDARTLFVFGGILFGAIISGTFVPETMVRIFNLFR